MQPIIDTEGEGFLSVKIRCHGISKIIKVVEVSEAYCKLPLLHFWENSSFALEYGFVF